MNQDEGDTSELNVGKAGGEKKKKKAKLSEVEFVCSCTVDPTDFTVWPVQSPKSFR